jgi:YD repeat-containing protein
MKVYISKYRNHWISPYTVLEKTLFWKDWDNISYETPWVDRWSTRLLPVCVAVQSVLDFVRPKINYVKIDAHDTWSMDHTLAMIVLPMLKQLKELKHGCPPVADEDVPSPLQSTAPGARDRCENDWDLDDNHFHRWDYVLDEMIFAFGTKLDESWQDKYNTGTIDWQQEPCAWDSKGKPTLYTTKNGPNHTFKCDYEGLRKEQARIANGFRLFGVYYEALWD